MRRPFIAYPALLLVAALFQPGLAAQVADDAAPDELIRAATQIPQLRTRFGEALSAFVAAIGGTYGDEGPALQASLDRLPRALADWDAAIRRYELAMAGQPEGVERHVALGSVYLQRGRVADARPEFAAAAHAAPSRPDVQVVLALLEAESGQPAAAYQAFARAAAADPGNPAIWYHLARQLTVLGETEQTRRALDNFSRLVEKRPGPFLQLDARPRWAAAAPVFAPAMYASGFALLWGGDYAAAVAEFKRAAAGDPIARTVSREPLARAAAALRAGTLGTALDALNAASRQHPELCEAHRLLGVALAADGDDVGAVAAFERAITCAPADERARVALADTQIAAGDHAAAERTLLETLAVMPESGRSHFVLARVEQALGRYDQALSQLQASLEAAIVAGREHVYQAVGSLHFQQTDLDAAIGAQSRRIELNPNNVLAHVALAELLSQQGRLEEAMPEVLAALAIEPGATAAWRVAAQLHLRSGRYSDAAAAAVHVLASDPDDAAALYVRGTALLRTGHADEGAAAMTRFQHVQAEALALEHRESENSARLQEAGAMIDARRYADAVPLLRAVVDAGGTVAPRARQMLRGALAALGEPSDAAADRAGAERPRGERLRRLGKPR